jgi:hypothetical protein
VRCFQICRENNWEQMRTSDHLDVLQARKDTRRFHSQDRKQSEQRVSPSLENNEGLEQKASRTQRGDRRVAR